MTKIILPFLLILSFSVSGQKVGIGTLSPNSLLHLKGTEDVPQLTIDAFVTQSNTNPLIRFRHNGIELLRIHSDNSQNIFIGTNSGRVNDAPGGATRNTFIGSTSGYSNTLGEGNTALGNDAMYTNATGDFNTAAGYVALKFNTIGTSNVAYGNGAMYENTIGNRNVAIGASALYSNLTGEN